MPDPDPVVIIRDLSFRYPETISGRRIEALRHVSLAIRPGEFTVVTGPSGSGKSTLARCLNGLIPHATEGTMEGDVIVRGMNTRQFDVPDFARHVGMVFQDPGYQLVTGDVGSEIAFGLEIQNVPETEIGRRLDEIAGLLRIRNLMGRTTGELSWGERQRVAIASVLSVRPSLLVMDEPYSGIDASTAGDLTRLLADLKARAGTTIIVFEHRTAGLLQLADRWITMRDGSIRSDGRPDRDGLCRPREDSPGRVPDTPSPEAPGCPSVIPGDPRARPLPDPALSFRDVVYRYPGAREPALRGITLDFYPCELTIVTGPNGSGKTTLLKHCNGLLVPERGSVLLGPDPLIKKTVAAAARTVAFLSQHADHQLFESSIAEEMAFGPRNLGMDERLIAGIVERTRHQCSLDHIDPKTPPLGLSGGEKQRVALAGILAMGTPVVILDEPTFGLDPALKKALAALLRSLCSQEKTVIVATHDGEFAEACGDRFIRIAAGSLESDRRRIPRQQRDPEGGRDRADGGGNPGGY